MVLDAAQDPNKKLETGIDGKIARLNSRPYFANYAINQVIKQMADNSSDPNFDPALKNNGGSYKTYNQITNLNKKAIIDQRSSDIFSTTIITDEYGREREGDIRSNTIIKSANSKIGLDPKTNQYVPSKNVFTFKGLDGNDTYQIEPPLFGQINITDSKENSKLILDGKEITAPAIAIKNQNTGEIIKNSWLLKHATSNNNEQQYLLQRIKSNFLSFLAISLLFLFLINFNVVMAEEINTANSKNPIPDKKVITEKKRYSEEQKQRVLKKIEELNKNSELTYNYLTKEEQKVRLEMMKERYPIGWYEEIMENFDEEDCNGYEYSKDIRCSQGKLLCKLNNDQIISIFLHYDDNYQLYSYGMTKIINIVLLGGGIEGYIDYIGSYDKNFIVGSEINEMINYKIILNKYSYYQVKNIKDILDMTFNQKLTTQPK